MTIPLQKSIIYGPVNSRRLGCSLGINVLPESYKVCSLNCLYCQYGWTKVHDIHLPSEKWPTVSKILQSLEDALKSLWLSPSYLTFSGNGEPTLHPNFIELVEGVIKLRDIYSPNSKTAILSNATTIDKKNIRKSLLKLDVKIMKFECGHEVTFRRYNRPCCDITLEKIFLGLKEIPGIIVQSLFTDGEMGNYHSKNIDKWIDKIVQLAPESVQLYTLDRSYPSDKISPLTSQKLFKIKDKLVERNITAEVFI